MNKIARVMTALTLIVTGASAVGISTASAMTTVSGGPYTKLNPNGADIHFGLAKFPTTSGLYIWQAVQGIGGARPTIINQAKTSQAWVSTSAGATPPTGDVKIRVTALFDTTDCSKVICGVFVRFDHTNPTDLSEDQFFPITFDTAAAPVAALAPDTVTATINGVALSSTAPATLTYRTPVTIQARADSGAATTISSSTPDCSVKGSIVEALKVVSAGCDIVVESAGTATIGAKAKHFPFMIAKAAQTIKQKVTNLKVGHQYGVVSKTNFGEVVGYTSTTKKICSVKGVTLVALKSGNCVLDATAVGTANYDELSITQSFLVVKK